MIRAALLLCLLAQPATALSCLRIDVTDAYREAAASDRTFVIAHGTLAFDEDQLPERTLAEPRPTGATIPARFRGGALGLGGFTTPWDGPVTLEVQCSGMWCGKVFAHRRLLGIFERTPEGWTLIADACGARVFPEPTAPQMAAVEACHRGKPCRMLR